MNKALVAKEMEIAELQEFRMANVSQGNHVGILLTLGAHAAETHTREIQEVRKKVCNTFLRH